MSDTYEVGYGKPPKQHRFQPGNQAARGKRGKAKPKGLSIPDIIGRALSAKRKIKRGNEIIAMPVAEILVERLVQMMTTGSARDLTTIIALLERYSPAYGALGEVQTVDGPITDKPDITRYRYDAALQLIGVVTPDPDGADPRLPMASKATYNADGQVTLREVGTVTDQSDAAWTAFSSAQQAATTYDTAGRPIKVVQSGGGVTTSVTQQSYDNYGRPDCNVVRMDPAQWAGQTNACVPQTTGPDGADRVTRAEYDLLDRVISITEGLNTPKEAVSGTKIYEMGGNKNGQIIGVKDGENNLTTYEYDNHDRLLKTRYPDTTKGVGTSSTSDYEQLTYDNASRASVRRLRDGQQIGIGYDNLGRVTSVDRPGTEPDLNIAYDLLGNTTQLTDTAGGSIGYTWNALGQQTSESSPLGTFGKSYDVAGRLTRLTWPDAFFVDYNYDTIGNVTAIRENGAVSGVGVLAQYSYDNFGRRIGIVRGNSANTGIGYDAPGRLQSIGHDFTGTANDVGWGYGYNGAGQLKEVARNNDAYAWGGHTTADRSVVSNGLNQTTSQSSVAGPVTTNSAFAYDSRGNLVTESVWVDLADTTTYGYDSLNQLKSALKPGATSTIDLAYDPAGRLKSLLVPTGQSLVKTKFAYVGSHLAFETDANNVILKRYVPGPGTDEPIVWYEGSGTIGRRWLHADERGSIVAVTDASGNAIAINRYDEYGIPQSGNMGRFQYTGQAWLPELGMSYYKARMYSPTLGRFMQTDPIGYGDGLNWYNYVGSDPVNRVDSSGKSCSLASAYHQHIWINYSGLVFGRWHEYGYQWNCTPDRSEFGLGGNGQGRGDIIGDEVVVLANKFKKIEMQSTNCQLMSELDPLVQKAYLDSKGIAFDIFKSSGEDNEIFYAMYRNNKYNNIEVYYEVMPSLGGMATIFREGLTLILFGHIHDVPVGNRPGQGMPGPSDDDMKARKSFPSATFVLHQNRYGKWGDVCY